MINEERIIRGLDKLEEKIDRVDDALRGKKGIIVRLDRVETWQTQTKWTLRAMFTAALAGAYEWLKK